MTTMSHRQTIAGSDQLGSELTSALGMLLERIEAETVQEQPRAGYEMTAAEVDVMLGLHRGFDRADEVARQPRAAGTALSPGGGERKGDATLPVNESLGSSAAIAELRDGSIFERSSNRRTALLAAALPVLAAVIVAIVALWSSRTNADAPTLEATASTVASSSQLAPSATATHVGGSAASETSGTTPAERTDAEIADAVELAMSTSGVTQARIFVLDGVVTVDAVAPVDLLAQGYFAHLELLEQRASVPGATEVHMRLELRGDAAMLRDELNGLSAEHPILFDSGSTEIAESDGTILDDVAAAIAAQPGLPVVIAGATDSSGSVESNERLANARAEAVAAALIERGIPEHRLKVVSYGELFGVDDGSARTVRFEVGT